jgi:hypothetical protein
LVVLDHRYGPRRQGWCYQDIMRWPPHHVVAFTLSRQLDALERRQQLHRQLELNSSRLLPYMPPSDYRYRLRRPPG